MRSAIFISLVLFLSLQSCKRTGTNENQSQPAGAEITFKEQTYDFGVMSEGDIVEHDFEFTNTGTVPVEIIDVRVQCGCTVASRPTKLIGVGRSDKITVRFNSKGKAGVNKKFVTVIANTDEPPQPIEFTATVTPAKSESSEAS